MPVKYYETVEVDELSTVNKQTSFIHFLKEYLKSTYIIWKGLKYEIKMYPIYKMTFYYWKRTQKIVARK